jgi:membrane protein YdbS with pleckstrin-like domain
MKDVEKSIERAEAWQATKALLIPLSLFIACVISAAGTFLIYNGEPVGWFFVAVALTIIVADFVGLIRFQNKYRAKGMIVSTHEVDPKPIDTPEILSELSDKLSATAKEQ